MECNSCNEFHSGENKSSSSLRRNLFGKHLVRIEHIFVKVSLKNRMGASLGSQEALGVNAVVLGEVSSCD